MFGYNVCFSIVFSLSWYCPCILKYCAKQENFTQWFNNTLFLAAIPAYHVSLSPLPQQSGGLYTETDQFLDPVKRQKNLQKVQTEKVFANQFTQIFPMWPWKLLSTYKRHIDTVRHRWRNERHRPGQHYRQCHFIIRLCNEVTECTYLHKHCIWITHAKVSTIFKHTIVWNEALRIYKHMQTQNKLIQLALFKTLVNKPQPSHATHNLITCKDSEIFEVSLFFLKSYTGR